MPCVRRSPRNALVDGFSGRRWTWCLAFASALLLTSTATAQVTRTFGNAGNSVTLEFWSSTDGGNGDGQFSWMGDTLRSTANWTNEEMDAVARGMQYWFDVLNSTPGRDITIRLTRVGEESDDGGTTWQSQSSHSSNPKLNDGGISSTVVNRIWAGGFTTASPEVVDGVINFDATEKLTAINGPLQMVPGVGIEATMIHEMAHTLGMVSARPFNTPLTIYEQQLITGFDPNGNPIYVTPGQTYNTDAAFFFYGEYARAVMGDTTLGEKGVPVPVNTQSGQKSHLEINAFTMTHLDYRNYPFFSEVELAVLQDLGYDIDRSKFFGRSFYVDGKVGDPQTINANTFDSAATYGVGLHIKASGRDILQTGNLNASGVAGNGIRIDGNYNKATVDSGVTINTNGDYGVGVLVSNGVNNVVVHRGTINANATTDGMEGIGLLFSFGNNTLGGDNRTSVTPSNVSGGFSGDYLVDRADISGSVSAGGAAILIDATAAVREINILQGADLSGNITSHALTNAGLNLNRPTITFGRQANPSNGQAINDTDADFNFTYAGDINGTTPMDAQFVGGIQHDTGTLLTGNVSFHSALVGADGRLTANGFFTSTTDIDIEGAMRSAGGLLIVGNSIIVHDGGRFSGTPTIVAPLVDNRPGGTMAAGNSIGTMNIVGTYQTNGTVEYEISHQNLPQDADLIRVTGQAFINNATSYADRGTFAFEGETSTNAEDYAIGRRYIILATDAPGNLNVAQRPQTTDNIDGRRIILRSDTDIDGLYTPDAQYYFAYIGRDTSYTTLGTTPNQQAIGAYLDNLLSLDDGSDLGNQMQWIRDTLDLIPDEDEVRAVYRMLSGEIYASVNPLVLQELSASQNRFAAHLRNEAARLAFCDEQGVRNTVGWTGWISGAGQAGETHSTSNAVGYHFQTGGTQAVVGYSLSCETMIGGFYEFTDMAFANSQTGSAQTELNEWGMFFTHHEDFAHITLIGSGGSVSNKIRRGFSFGNTAIQLPIQQSLAGDYHGSFASVYGEVGLHLRQGWLSFHPFLGLSYTHLGEDAFTEKGDLFALRVQESAVASLRSAVGLDVSALLFGYRSTSLDFRSMWMHDFLFGGVDSVVAGIDALPSGTFTVKGTDIGRDFAVLGTGLSFDLVPGRVRIGGGYDLIINRYQTMNVGSGTLEVVW